MEIKTVCFQWHQLINIICQLQFLYLYEVYYHLIKQMISNFAFSSFIDFGSSKFEGILYKFQLIDINSTHYLQNDVESIIQMICVSIHGKIVSLEISWVLAIPLHYTLKLTILNSFQREELWSRIVMLKQVNLNRFNCWNWNCCHSPEFPQYDAQVIYIIIRIKFSIISPSQTSYILSRLFCNPSISMIL